MKLMNKETKVGLLCVLVFIMVLLSFSFFSGIVTAVDSITDIGTGKIGQDFRVKQTCNGATYITISSITYPNKTVAVSNVNMTYFGNGEYFYNFSQTSAIGTIETGNPYFINFLSDGCQTSTTVSFGVTTTGQVLQTSDSILYLIILAIFVILFGFAVYKLFNSNSIVWVLSMLAGAYFSLLGIVFMASLLVNNFIPSLAGMGSLLNMFLIIMLVGIFPLIIFLILYLLGSKIRDRERDDLMKMGYSAEESRKYRK